MTIDEAVRILDPKTTAEALAAPVAGIAVCPPLAEAMVRANLPEWCSRKIETMAELDKVVTA